MNDIRDEALLEPGDEAYSPTTVLRNCTGRTLSITPVGCSTDGPEQLAGRGPDPKGRDTYEIRDGGPAVIAASRDTGTPTEADYRPELKPGHKVRHAMKWSTGTVIREPFTAEDGRYLVDVQPDSEAGAERWPVYYTLREPDNADVAGRIPGIIYQSAMTLDARHNIRC